MKWIKHFMYEQTQPAITCSKLTIDTLEQGVQGPNLETKIASQKKVRA